MSDVDSDDDRRASKKRKASRACDRCNTQHQPCDNKIPKCSVCERAGSACTYDRPIRKRGPRSGYTAQFGERLWGLVLQARPDIEDLVVSILANGSYGDTGISNAEYFRNSSHHPELVARFNESRLGRFVHSGDPSDLRSSRNLETSLPATAQGVGQMMSPTSNGGSSRQIASVTDGDLRSGTAFSDAASPQMMNPHGAPQNPSDIYTQSEDIRRHVSGTDESRGQSSSRSPSQGLTRTPTWQAFPANPSSGNAASFDTSGLPGDYKVLGHRNVQNFRAAESIDADQTGLLHLCPLPGPPQAAQSRAVTSASQDGEAANFDIVQTTPWYDTVPTETLLNLGFAGDGMAQDFLDLCENPDPIGIPAFSMNSRNSEDEEAVFRALVMRGRFV